MGDNLRERLLLLGVPVDIFTSMTNLKEYTMSLIVNGQSNHIIFLTYAMVFKARRNPQFLQMLEEAALVLPAEPSIVKGLSFVYKRDFMAFLPVDIVMAILAALEKRPGSSAYLLGGSQKNAVRVYQNLKASYPQMLFVGYHPGNMKEKEINVIEAIRKASPTLLITSKGVAKGERWLYHHNKGFKPGLTLYCRDCFDIFLSKKRRPAQRELQNQGGFHFSRLLSYPIYGINLLGNRMKVKKAQVNE